MAITAPDIKLLESERMADTTDGGGRRTSRVIPDGVAGNIFPKVSRLDSVYGRVNLRKVYGAVQTADVDTYAGAHVVITDAPDNANIHTTLFSTASEFDSRTAARDRIESYVTYGPESRMLLLGKQLTGQAQIIVYQRIDAALPEIGEVYCLTSEVNAVVGNYQYFRAQSVDSEVRTFEDDKGEFTRTVITIGTGVPLRYDFGVDGTASRTASTGGNSKLRTTNVVDAARYFGIKPLSEAAASSDLTVKVSSVYTPIVPTTNRETPVVSAHMGAAINLVAAKATAVSETVSATWPVSTTYISRRPIKPGSLSISGAGVTATSDDKIGTITNSTFSATVDYESGSITRTGGTASASSYTLNYTPAGAAPQTAHTHEEEITIGNRGTVYVYTFNPIPSPGTTYVDYRALGKWYRLRDNGAGVLSGGDAAYGVGSIDYTTGGVVLTLGALPDVGSSIIIGYGSPLHFRIRADGTSDAGTTLKQTITLPDVPVAPNSVALTYTSLGVTYPATDNASGVITGDGISGKVDYTTGVIDLVYATRLPDAVAGIVVNYNKQIPVNIADIVVLSKSEAYASPVSLGTSVVEGSFNGALPLGGGGSVFIVDNGAGLVLAKGGQTLPGYFTGSEYKWTLSGASGVRNGRISGDQVIGTINYATGEVTITTGVTVDYEWYKVSTGSLGIPATATWESAQAVYSFTSGTANYGWKDSGISTSVEAKTFNATFSANKLRVDLTSTVAEKLIPGSLMFTAGGKTFIDRNGSLYYDVSNVTGAGTLAGTIDYDLGTVSLSSWVDGATLSLSVGACLTTPGDNTEFEVFLRTSGSPLRFGSFYVQATTENGTLLSATSSEAGTISGTKVSGVIDQITGVVRLKFGQMVAAAGNETQWWYNAANVVGGQIFKPELIIPSTLTYNAVVLANLPLNADILGLDPVRLPADGRVPIYRAADVVVIHNTQDFALPNPVVAGATYSVGRTNLSEVWLVDQNGVRVNADQYIYSLNNGTVTMGAELLLTGLVQPLIAKHRVEDLALLSDVQINGQLTLSAPLTRAYPANTSFVSSAILFGDMNARVENVHDLLAFSAWTNTVGTGATAQYNDIDYPIEILNNGGLTERWRINFTSTSAFQVIGENLGVIATGSTSSDCSPTNALTGNPYFVIRAAGWGTGWSAGNQLRFNTIGAAAPIWIARTILPGATLSGDSFSLQCRGDVDAA